MNIIEIDLDDKKKNLLLKWMILFPLLIHTKLLMIKSKPELFCRRLVLKHCQKTRGIFPLQKYE